MICTVVGARPNFVKLAPVILEARRRGIRQVFVHTGQHYDEQMSAVFFDELGMPKPDVYLGVGSGSHATQTARVMMSFEEVCLQHQPRLVLVAGDVNSTIACALTAAKLNIPVAHAEAGLRSFDRTMPEEINRILTDHVAELLFTTEPSGERNLLYEGVPKAQIFFVGNTMIDTLNLHINSVLKRAPWGKFGLDPKAYAIVTLHRASNVDLVDKFDEIISALEEVGRDLPVLFPAHPRTKQRFTQAGFEVNNIQIIEPLGYLDFLGLMARAKLVLTDSGGIQEETTALQVPCITIRENTERPVTIEQGTNRLAGTSKIGILAAVAKVASSTKAPSIPHLWDGKASVRVVDAIETWLSNGER